MIKPREWLTALAIMTAGIACSIWLGAQIKQRLLHADQALVSSTFTRLQSDLHEREFAVEQIAAAWEQIATPDERSWQSLVQLYLAEYPESPGLVWAPLVMHSDRPEFEAKSNIREVHPDGPPRLSSIRDRYAPIEFVGGRSVQTSQAALGLDLLSETSRRLMLERAEATGATIISQPIELVTHLDQPAVLIAHHVNTTRKTGFVAGAYLTQPMIERAFDARSLGASLWIHDPSTPELPIYPATHGEEMPTQPARGNIRYNTDLQIGEREWQATLDRPLPSLPLWPYAIGLISILACLAVLTYLWRFRAAERDYSERLEQATFALTESNRVLADKNRELEAFAYAASHDLQAPLRGIRNLAQWLSEDLPRQQLSDENADYLARLDALSKKMSTMISGLLSYSRAGDLGEPARWIDIQALVDEITQENQLPVVQCNHSVQLHTRHSALKSVLSALIKNGFSHNTNPSPQVDIWIDPEQPTRMQIYDNGPGISPHQTERVFEIFQTLQPQNGHEVAGMGLAIARKLVRSVNGSLNVMAHPHHDRGACFELIWPAQHQGENP